MGGDIPARVETHVRWTATGALDKGSVKLHPLLGEIIDIGRFQCWVAVTAQIIGPQLVAHDKEDVSNISHEANLPGGVVVMTEAADLLGLGPLLKFRPACIRGRIYGIK